MGGDLMFVNLRFLSFSGLGPPLTGPSNSGNLTEFCGLANRSLTCRMVSFRDPEAENRCIQIPWDWIDAISADLISFGEGGLDLRAFYNPDLDFWESNLLSVSVVVGARQTENHVEWIWNPGSAWKGADADLIQRLVIWLEQLQAAGSQSPRTMLGPD